MTFDGRVEAQMTVPSGITVTATNAGGTATVTFPVGTYFPSTLVSQLATTLNNTSPLSATWTATLSTGASGTGLVTLNGGGTWSIVWGSATGALRDLLGFTGDINNSNTSQTGTNQARGLWIPDCPIWMQGDPKRAPRVSDLRTTTSPTGVVYGLVGNFSYRHRQVRWSHVALAKTWEVAATTTNASFEFFFGETQLGLGSSWFTPASAVKIYDHAGNVVGSDKSIASWFVTGVKDIEPARVDQAGWNGYWRIEFPEIVSSG